jgi:N6-L-threonylcarbamoyladenine synthase
MIIGIDTSCYTTSIALINDDGSIIKNHRLMLQVKPGQRGLRQSEAVFQHIQNLPRLVEDISETIPVLAVSASTKPRPVAGSYLPVFKVGASFGATLARLIGVPFYETSHQEGHLRAGFCNGELPNKPFLAWHLSGGTTELLLIKTLSGGFNIEKVGGSSDLQVGQLVDRIGVALGAGFPAGKYLEELAKQSQSTESLPVVTKDLTISFSGPDTAGKRLLDAGINHPELARRVFNCICRSLIKVTLEAARRYQVNLVLLAGGVASNELIRMALLEEKTLSDLKLVFAPKELSSDNAVGVGLIGLDLYRIK